MYHRSIESIQVNTFHSSSRARNSSATINLFPRFPARTTTRGYITTTRWTVPVSRCPGREEESGEGEARIEGEGGERRTERRWAAQRLCLFDSHKPRSVPLILIGSVEIAASCFGNPPLPPPPVLIKPPSSSRPTLLLSNSFFFLPLARGARNPLPPQDGRPF